MARWLSGSSSSWARRVAAAVAAALLLPAVLPGQPDGLEYRVKAAVLHNITHFVKWPGDDRPGLRPLGMCVFGEDPFGGALDREVTRDGDTRRFVVRRFRDPEDLQGCEVLYISLSEKRRAPSILRAAGTGLLTVSDIPGFAAAGGIVGFVVEDGKIRFEINLTAARRAHISVSSQLLQLARIVESRTERDR